MNKYKYKVVYYYTNKITLELLSSTLEEAKKDYFKLLKQSSALNKLYIYNNDEDITSIIYNEYIINNLI